MLHLVGSSLHYSLLVCFYNQVIQLYETMLVRHGVMLVGPTGGGKTTVYSILADTLESLHRTGHKDNNPFYQPVKTYVLNPKSVTMGELYGEVPQKVVVLKVNDTTAYLLLFLHTFILYTNFRLTT